MLNLKSFLRRDDLQSQNKYGNHLRASHNTIFQACCNLAGRMNKIRLAKKSFIFIALLSYAGFANAAIDEAKYSFSGFLIPNHPLAINGEQFFINRVEELTDGKVTFEYYPASQLGKAKDFLNMLDSGATDFAIVSPAYVPEELPLSSVAELPRMYKNSCSGSEALYELLQPGGILYETEFKPKGLRVISAWITEPYQINSVDKELNSVEDIKGLKIKTAGGAAASTARALGAVPVQLTQGEVYTAIKRKMINGRFGVYEFLPQIKQADLFNNGLTNVNIAGFSETITIPESTWNKMDPELQSILMEAGKETYKHYCKEAESAEQKFVQEMQDEYGWTITSLDESNQAQLEELLKPVLEEWADRLDQRYKNNVGHEAINAFLEQVDKQ